MRLLKIIKISYQAKKSKITNVGPLQLYNTIYIRAMYRKYEGFISIYIVLTSTNTALERKQRDILTEFCKIFILSARKTYSRYNI